MRIINSRDIMETIEMLTAENLDVRTVTMGISLLDCIDPDADKACEKIYNKITRLAGNLVSVVDLSLIHILVHLPDVRLCAPHSGRH